jgi:type III secretory pathway component EscV
MKIIRYFFYMMAVALLFYIALFQQIPPRFYGPDSVVMMISTALTVLFVVLAGFMTVGLVIVSLIFAYGKLTLLISRKKPRSVTGKTGVKL